LLGGVEDAVRKDKTLTQDRFNNRTVILFPRISDKICPCKPSLKMKSFSVNPV
jgi:hypothetical protein